MTQHNQLKDAARALQAMTGQSYQQCLGQVRQATVDQRRALAARGSAPAPTPVEQWACWRQDTHPVRRTALGWPQCTVCQAAPPYHERYAYAVAAELVLDLLVPAGATTIAAGSGVVALPVAAAQAEGDGSNGDGGTFRAVYYEGFVYGSRPVGEPASARWQDGVRLAAERLLTAYPTVARMHLPPAHLIVVGRFDVATRTFTVTDQDRLDTWLTLPSTATAAATADA